MIELIIGVIAVVVITAVAHYLALPSRYDPWRNK